MATIDAGYLRGSRLLAPVNHIVMLESRAGSWQIRRVSLNADLMGKLELRLMSLQHDGRIKSYMITAANDCNFADLLTWLKSFDEQGQQQELLSIEQNSLFAGGAQ